MLKGIELMNQLNVFTQSSSFNMELIPHMSGECG